MRPAKGSSYDQLGSSATARQRAARHAGEPAGSAWRRAGRRNFIITRSDHPRRQVGVLAQRKATLSTPSCRRTAELDQHAHAPAQRRACRGMCASSRPSTSTHRNSPAMPRCQLQQGGLAAAAAAHDGHHLAAMHGQVDAAQHLTLAIGEARVAQRDDRRRIDQRNRHEKISTNSEPGSLADDRCDPGTVLHRGNAPRDVPDQITVA